MLRIKEGHLSEAILLNITKAPGAQYILVNENGIIAEYNAGYADLVDKTPVTSKTTFNNFSVTKTATATAILQLAEQKKILLSDLVNPMFNEFNFKFPFTIRQIVTHQAGLTDPIPISWIHLFEEENRFDENSFIRQTVNKYSKQKFVPGTKFSYSSIGYLLLSMIIEKISGESYTEYISKNILPHSNNNGTLGFKINDRALQASGYHPRFSLSNMILGLFLDRKKFIRYNHGSWTAFNNFYINGKAYGGFIGNTRGLASYLQCFLLNKIFSNPETQQLMFTEQKAGMAYGWFTGTLNGNKYLCHAGGGGGYYCEIRIYPELKLASAVLRNRSSFSDLRLLDKIDPDFIG